MGRVGERSDDDRGGYMFRSQSVLEKKVVNRLVRRYNIPNFYMRQASKSGMYMSNTKYKEIVIYVAYLEAGLRFPLHPFFIWFIKTFWIQPAQLMLNRWRYLVAYVWF